jgi:hypothetical protein
MLILTISCFFLVCRCISVKWLLDRLSYFSFGDVCYLISHLIGEPIDKSTENSAKKVSNCFHDLCSVIKITLEKGFDLLHVRSAGNEKRVDFGLESCDRLSLSLQQ